MSIKTIKTFLIEDFFHLPPLSVTPVVHLMGAWKKLIHEKNLKTKISRLCPFKLVEGNFSYNFRQSTPERKYQKTTTPWSRSCHVLTGVPGSQSTTGTGGSADLRTTVVQVMPRADRRAWLSEYYRYRRIS